MEAFFNQLAIVLLICVAVLVACVTYKTVYSKISQPDSTEISSVSAGNKNKVEKRPVIRGRKKTDIICEMKGEPVNGEITAPSEVNE